MSDLREVQLLNRLAECNIEWGTSAVVDDDPLTAVMVEVHRLPPLRGAIKQHPFVYADPPSYEEEDLASGLDRGFFTINMPVCVAPMTNVKSDADGTATAMNQAAWLQAAARGYYDAHRQLQTEADPGGLDCITNDIKIRVSPVGEIVTIYGSQIGFIISLTVPTL